MDRWEDFYDQEMMSLAEEVRILLTLVGLGLMLVL